MKDDTISTKLSRGDYTIAFNMPADVMEFLFYARKKLEAKDVGEVIHYALIALRQTFANEEKDREGN